MSIPIRMNMVDIVLRRLNAVATAIDPDFREQKRSKKFMDPVTIRGQANFAGKPLEDRFRSHTGDVGTSSVWFVFRMSDLVSLGFEPKKGDRIAAVAGRTYNLEVKETRPESPLRGKFLLLYVIVEEVKEERASV